MHELDILLIAFLALNVLDAATTVVATHVLPKELRATEANPIYKDVERSWVPPMIRKFIFVVVGTWGLLALHQYHNVIPGFRALNMVLLIVVINNASIIISRLVLKRKTSTPISWIVSLGQKVIRPQKFARVISFYVFMGALTAVCYVISLAIGVG